MASLIAAVLAGIGVERMQQADCIGRAWQELTSEMFDLLVLDRQLCDGDGLDLVLRLRAMPGRKAQTPIIMLTASGSKASVTAARDAGVDEYLIKPFTVSSIHDRLVSVLQRPRRFIRSGTYLGPDRRRRADPGYNGPERRSGTTATQTS